MKSDHSIFIVKYLQYFITLLFYILLSPLFSIYGDVEKIQLKADFTHYEETTKQLIASSNVRLKYGNVTIKAPYIKLDTLGNIITSTGKINIKRGEDEFDSSYLFFDLNNDRIIIKDIHIGIENTDKNIKDLFYIKADEIADNKKLKTGQNGLFTSCDLHTPHYYFWASKFDYYTDKRIIGYHTVLYTPFFLIPFPVPFITLHYSPFYSYDLGKRKHIWNFPTIGKKETEGWGWFVQNTIDYNNINGKDSSVLIDWFENKGIGAGIRHQYEVNDNHGTLYYYQLREADTNILNEKKSWDQKLKLSDQYRLILSYSDVNAERINSRGRNESLEKFFHVFYDDIGDKSDLSYKENQNFNQQYESYNIKYKKSFNSINQITSDYSENHNSGNQYLRKNANLTHILPLPSDINIKNNIQYKLEHKDYFNTAHADDQLKYYFTFNKKLSNKLSATIKFDHFIDLDENRVTSDTLSAENNFFFKHPEINFKYTENNLASFTFTEDITIARYQETRFDSKSNKVRKFPEEFGNKFEPNTYIFKQKLSRTFSNLPEKSTFSLDINFDQYIFKNDGFALTEGDSMNTLGFGATYKSEHMNFIKTSTRYSSSYAPSEGNSPFYQFKRSSARINEIYETLTFYLFDASKYYWKNDSGYNFITEKYRDWDTKLFLKPNKSIELALYTGQKLNKEDYVDNNKYKDFRSELRLTPTNNVKLSHSITFDMNRYMNDNDAIVKNSQFLFDFVIGKNKDYIWKFQTAFLYDVNNKEFDISRYELNTFTLVKEEHKRSVFISYNKQTEETRFKLTINAFPNDPIGFRKNKEIWRIEGVLDKSSEERL